MSTASAIHSAIPTGFSLDRGGDRRPLRGDCPGRPDRAGLLRRGRTPHDRHARLIPGAVIAAAAGTTRQIRLGSSVNVLSTDEPPRGGSPPGPRPAPDLARHRWQRPLLCPCRKAGPTRLLRHHRRHPGPVRCLAGMPPRTWPASMWPSRKASWAWSGKSYEWPYPSERAGRRTGGTSS